MSSEYLSECCTLASCRPPVFPRCCFCCCFCFLYGTNISSVLEFVCLPWSEVCSARVTSLLLLLLLLLIFVLNGLPLHAACCSSVVPPSMRGDWAWLQSWHPGASHAPSMRGDWAWLPEWHPGASHAPSSTGRDRTTVLYHHSTTGMQYRIIAAIIHYRSMHFNVRERYKLYWILICCTCTE